MYYHLVSSLEFCLGSYLIDVQKSKFNLLQSNLLSKPNYPALEKDQVNIPLGFLFIFHRVFALLLSIHLISGAGHKFKFSSKIRQLLLQCYSLMVNFNYRSITP